MSLGAGCVAASVGKHRTQWQPLEGSGWLALGKRFKLGQDLEANGQPGFVGAWGKKIKRGTVATIGHVCFPGFSLLNWKKEKGKKKAVGGISPGLSMAGLSN